MYSQLVLLLGFSLNPSNYVSKHDLFLYYMGVAEIHEDEPCEVFGHEFDSNLKLCSLVTIYACNIINHNLKKTIFCVV